VYTGHACGAHRLRSLLYLSFFCWGGWEREKDECAVDDGKG
jgi:hypothetical protein